MRGYRSLNLPPRAQPIYPTGTYAVFLHDSLDRLAGPRVVAIGDIHADPEAASDPKDGRARRRGGAWSGGRRSSCRPACHRQGTEQSARDRILTKLQPRRARRRDVAVLGNTVMNIVGDWRGVRTEDLNEYDAPETRMADLRPRGVMGQWIHGARMVVFRGDTVFVHGGVSAEMASLGRATLAEIQAKHVGVASHKALFGSDGPMWYRGYLVSDEETACAEVKQALAKLEARRTRWAIPPRRTARSGRDATGPSAIDTVSALMQGISAFELINGDARAIAFRVIARPQNQRTRRTGPQTR